MSAPQGLTLTPSERSAAASIARDLAKCLLDVAERIETSDSPRKELDAVRRVQAALNRRGSETLARLDVLEVLHRGFEAQRLAMDRRPPLKSIGPDCFAVQVARDLYRPSALPGSSIGEDPALWAKLMTAWQIGRGDKGRDKWALLAKLLTQQLGDKHIAGSTLRGHWNRWLKMAGHMRTPPKRVTKSR